MKLHNEEDTLIAGKALAMLVQRFREMKPAGKCGEEAEHTLALMDQQSAMILAEYDVEDCSMGDC